LAFVVVRDATIVKKFSIVRLEMNSLVVVLDCAIILTLIVVGNAPITENFSVVWLEANSFVVVSDRQIVL
jgi:hypothetical protein